MQSVREVVSFLKTIGILDITDNSKNANKLTAFFCTQKAKEMNYHVEALNAGAIIIQISKEKSELPYVNLEKWEDYVELLNLFFFNENENAKIIGITGTNGKTSSVHFGAQLCSLMGKYSATIGTNGVCLYQNGVIISQENTGLTTATCTYNHSILNKLAKNGVKFIFMEVSSIGIHQGRIDGIQFDVSCFTNFTQDHLDYHKTTDEYFKQKLRLFAEYTKTNGLCVLNGNDEKAKIIAQSCRNCEIFSKNASILNSYRQNENGFNLIFKNAEIASKQFNVFGNFQITNLLGVVYSLLFLGFKIQDIAKNIPKVTAPLGRMQNVKVGNVNVVIDYAHTPDALENVLKNVNGYKICVFGCGGNRDSTKREIMGKISSKFAQYTVITNDNPRFEDPQIIANAIALGFQNENYTIILDRKSAILHAIELCKNVGGTVVIAGKGSESYQEVNGIKNHFSDFEVVESITSQ